MLRQYRISVIRGTVSQYKVVWLVEVLRALHFIRYCKLNYNWLYLEAFFLPDLCMGSLKLTSTARRLKSVLLQAGAAFCVYYTIRRQV